jgi:argininosuccinate lyase
MKLWGGRFKEGPDARFSEFNSSFRFDRRMIEADIESSRAYAEALLAAGVLDQDEASRIDSGLREILKRAREEPGYLDTEEPEDVHSFVESELVRSIGNAGYKLHTGRSRNDQVATDLRLFVREETDRTGEMIRALQTALLNLAEENIDCVMPGYTHLQRAQPVLFAHYLMAYFEMLERDRERLKDARSRINRLPLGSGALAGSGFPIDRDLLARRLGFEGVCENSLDAVSDRDFVIEFLAAAALIMIHLSRLAEDLIIYSSAEFGFVQLSDLVATGSSLMPQKKNPDSLELIRGKAGRVFGHVTGLLACMKGLPLAYNKDMQEDKEALFDTIDTIQGSLEVARIVISNISIDSSRMEQAARGGYMNATDLADYLTRQGLEFRLAHETVGRVVGYAIERNKSLDQLALDEYKQFSPLFQADLYDAISIGSSLASKSVKGGTSRSRVIQAIARAREIVAAGPSQSPARE